MANNQSPDSRIKLQRLHPDAIAPTVGTPESACYDLYALEDVEFSPGEIKVIRTGWKIEPPKGWRINIYVRSSTPAKKGFILANSVGIIDEDYRGEFGVQLMNVNMAWMDDKPAERQPWGNRLTKGDKIAQFELVPSNPASNFSLEEVSELSATKRGEGGFGSTGK